MDKLRVLIVDDEELARMRLRKLLAREDDVELVGECCDGVKASACIRTAQPDLVFLDIHMRRMTGLELVAELPPEKRPFIILVTAYDRYALNAFEADVLDYLLKPFSDERFYAALARARERVRQQQISTHTEKLLSLLKPTAEQEAQSPNRIQETANHQEGNDHGRLVLKLGSHLLFLNPDQIDWIEAEGVYVRVHVDVKAHLLRESMASLEQRLDARQFLRIHRSTIVNVDRIREVVPHQNGGSVVILKDGRRFKMSRSYRDKFSEMWGGSMRNA